MKMAIIGSALFLGGIMLVCASFLPDANGITLGLGFVFGLWGLMILLKESFNK